VGTIDTSTYAGRPYGRPASASGIRSRHIEAAGVRPPGPPAAVLVGASVWALGSAVVSAVVGAAALVTVAGDPPTWYKPSMLAIGAVSLIGTIGGLRLVEVAWLRWKLLALGTTATAIAALLTVAALAGVSP
jgi:hypothetical protein